MAMEQWSSEFLQFSPLEVESLYSLLSPSPSIESQMPVNTNPQPPPPLPPPPSPPPPVHLHQWTWEENKIFESALAEVDPASPLFYESLAVRLPWKSIDEVKAHYEALVRDIEMIEAGNFVVDEYPPPSFDEVADRLESKKKHLQDQLLTTPPAEPARTKSGLPRRRGIPWTEEEHQLFLMGLNKYGKGDWRSISRYYVITKTPTQVASHAQKYFRRLNSSTPPDRRRPSIHDIHTVNPITAATFNSTIPAFNQCAMNLAMIPNLRNSYGANGLVLDANPQLVAAAVNQLSFPATTYGQASTSANAYSAANSPPPCFLQAFNNQYWS